LRKANKKCMRREERRSGRGVICVESPRVVLAVAGGVVTKPSKRFHTVSTTGMRAEGILRYGAALECRRGSG